MHAIYSYTPCNGFTTGIDCTCNSLLTSSPGQGRINFRSSIHVEQFTVNDVARFHLQFKSVATIFVNQQQANDLLHSCSLYALFYSSGIADS